MTRLGLATLLSCLLLTGATVAFAGSITQEFHFNVGDVQLGADRGYATVDYAGAPHTGSLGSPDLPVLVCQVVIPPSAEVTGFEVVSLVEELLKGTHDVLPVQLPMAWSPDWPEQPFTSPDPAYYSVDAPHPQKPAQLGSTGNKAGYRLVNFGVYPVRYNPVRRELSLVREVAVRVHYATGKHRAARRTEVQNQIHGEHVANLVLNPRDVSRFAPPVRHSSYGSAFLPPGDFEHIIITRAVFADSFAQLRDWRTRQGWRSKVMPLESICAVYPGRDTAEKMRNFIKDADTTWGTLFVFIARDDYPSGTNQVRQARAYDCTMKSDMYFSDLDGDWDRNGNNTFGEVADSVDGYADVFVGMITLKPGYNKLGNYLAKLLRYELSPDTTVNWVPKSLLPNGVTFSNEFNDSVAIATPTPPWFDCKMYTSGGMVTPSAQKFCDSINSGYGLASIIAHGSPELFQLGSNVTSPMMNALTNTNRLNFSTYVCCNTGEWNLGSTNGDCIAENMVFHAPNGFVGVAKNDKSGWVRCAEFFNYSICYGVVGFRTNRRVTQGEALSYGKDYWVWCINDSGKWRMEAFERNLFGEPAVPLWTGQPFVAQVTRPGAVNIGSNVPVQITVSDGFGPVQSALVCLTKGTETFGRGWTDASGELTLYVSPLTPGWMHLTVTGANNIPYLDSIPVIAAGKYVTYLRHAISDPPPGGNGDGVLNPGETVRIPTWVKNHGTQTANGVTGRLITHTPGATITDPLKTFGNIPGGDSLQNTQGFEMQVAPGLPNNYAIQCSVVCKDANDTTWVSYVTFRVGAPVLSFVSKQVRDEGSARPNRRLDPGETADLEVTIRNSGLGHGYNVRAVLRSGDSRLSVNDSTATYGTVMVDSTGTNTTDRFTLAAAAGIVPGSEIPCTLNIYADAGYAGCQVFSLSVGEIWRADPIPDGPRQPALYWAYDDADTACEQRPVFSWVEIKSLGTRLNFANNDAVIAVNLPPAFGPFIYYGQRFTRLSVSADGWVAPDSYTTSHFSNTGLPSASGPRGAICANWDDLNPGCNNSGYVYYYHDAANHRFVVEFDSVAYFSASSVRDKFEVIFYDTTLAAADSNSVFLFQYLTANGYTSNTIGIQDPARAIGIQALFNNDYHAACWPLGPRRAIKFMTDLPTGIAEPPLGPPLNSRRLVVVPNPLSSGFATLRFGLPKAGPVSLTVFDVAGRCVLARRFDVGTAPGAARTSTFAVPLDMRSLSSGVYLVRLDADGCTATQKLVVQRKDGRN